MSDTMTPIDDALDEAAKLGRAALDACLDKLAPDIREAFWNAIGLYYSTRRHPGADEPNAQAGADVIAA